MSDEDYSSDRLFEFLRESTIRGLLNPAVAKSRLNACEQLFVELQDDEKNDIRLIDVDTLCSRLHKIQNSSIRPEVLELYNQRVKAALTDYLSWLKKPACFYSIGGDSIRKDKRYEPSAKEVSLEQQALEEITLTTSSQPNDIISVPLREDRTVYIKNLPLDLSLDEAMKIARVIKALAINNNEQVE
ncbi:hypothetical protein [Aliikangiella maris]|uniref:Uncharacterized protein n=2 Tax=Aliikangiella maris TaxID=3162458 RepID=A0ABV2BQ45_9GAMM